MRTLRQHLHLQHSNHTGRVLHHKHTSYRALAIVIGLAGTLVLALNILSHAAADSMYVYARNPAPIPTEPAVITSPVSGTVTTKARLDVAGTCPVTTPAVVIGILDNGILSGSTPCSDGTFTLPIAITPGRHVLIARIYTITNDVGPDSEPVTVFLTLPSGAYVAPDDQNGATTGLTVTIDIPFITFGPAKNAIWEGTITGGKLPYQVHMQWGDGTANDYTVRTEGKQQFAHHYRSMKPHTITMKVSDADGRGAIKHYAAVTPYVPPALGTVTTLPWKGSMPWGLYGAYLLLIVVFGGLWARAHPFAYASVPVRRRSPAVSKQKRRNTSHSS